METVERICPRCHAANPVEAVYCGACATQLRSPSTALARRPEGVLARRPWHEAMPALAVGVAALAGRLAVEVLRNPELLEGALRLLQRPKEQPAPKAAPLAPPRQPNVLIRRRWVVGDEGGARQWGSEEIEIHHPE